jgi:2-dehydropantoate 2-reductase
MKIAVIGTGALGGYYGARLAHSGNELHFLLYSDYDHVKKNGLRVESIDGDFSIKNPYIYQNIQSMPQCELLLIATKSTTNKEIFPQLKSVVGENTVIVLLQNGLGTEAILNTLFPSNSIIGALAFLCSNKVGPGHINHLDFGSIKMALQSGKKDDLEITAAAFKDSGITVTELDDLPLARWQKLMWNIPFNGLSVVLDSSTDIITSQKDACSLAEDLMKEVLNGANACGVLIEEDFITKMIEYTKSMKPYDPSMRIDFLRKREMELETIYAEPIRQAKQRGCWPVYPRCYS